MTAASPQRVLTIADDAELLSRLAAAVQAAGASPVLVPGLDRLTGGPDQLPFRFVVCAAGESIESYRAVADRLREGAQMIAITPNLSLDKMVKIVDHPICHHTLRDDASGLQQLEVCIRKFVTGDLFGIEKYLPAGTEVRLTRLREYKGRTAAIDEVLAYAETVGVRRQVRLAIGQVCEELLMNALYDAPVDETGNPIFAEVELKARLDKLSPRPVSIRYAATERGFSVSVRDRFGRLDKATVLRYIEKCLHSPQQIDRKVYGAGLGIYLIANAASRFVLNVAPGIATEVVCSFDRSTRSSLQSFSVFVHPGQQLHADSPSDGRTPTPIGRSEQIG